MKVAAYVFIASGILIVSSAPAVSADAQIYEDIDWTELMPAEDLSALLNRPAFLDDIADGSAQDALDSFQQRQLEDEQAQQYQAALSSTRVIQGFDGKAIRIPGFIVPLEQNEDKEVTRFFIVPYFGACLHMPPPPPNQILYVESEQGITLENLYDPYWFEGVVSIEQKVDAMGTSAYSLSLDNYALYEE
ncbi:DUF3299 domain-containing protein [Alteromonas australica]|uniref:DUF3299 domain-containing protein n=1 Tax=Alteromonas australica TaxID=589873 RepID=A0A075P3Z3_9ALTE|nr:DUF3299 domain-containing protein [Alteromonas australica]AIG00389.1 hypothetical protein EP13_17815 [Alteromonas australica]